MLPRVSRSGSELSGSAELYSAPLQNSRTLLACRPTSSPFKLGSGDAPFIKSGQITAGNGHQKHKTHSDWSQALASEHPGLPDCSPGASANLPAREFTAGNGHQKHKTHSDWSQALASEHPGLPDCSPGASANLPARDLPKFNKRYLVDCQKTARA